MRPIWLPFTLLLMTSLMLTIKGQGLPAEDSDFFGNLNCSTDATVCKDDLHQVCGTLDNGTKLCRCKTEELWKKVNDRCVKQEELFQKCGDSSPNPAINCAVPGSKCILSDWSEPRWSCMCEAPDYVDIPNPQNSTVPAVYKFICGKVLPRGVEGDVNDCNKCNPVASKCYSLPANGVFGDKSDGCKCDVSFSGPTCYKEHVSVSCNFTEKKMTVCYLPHDDVDTTSPVDIYVTGLGDVPECTGELIKSNNQPCSNGSYVLTVNLPVDGESDNKCNTLMTRQDHMRRFENTIEVKKGADSTETLDFTVYCRFEDSTFRSAGAIIKSPPTNNRGESLLANVSMSVLDQTNKPLGDYPQIHTKDKIKFQISLSIDDTYGALLPTYCTASPYGSQDSPKGININEQLLIDSCPVPGLPAINQMKFMRKDGLPNVVITDEMNLMKLKVGDTIYIHCKVKLCLRGSESACDMPNCQQNNTRRKREVDGSTADEEDTAVILSVIGDEQRGVQTITISMMGFAIIITLLVALVIVIVAVGLVVFLRLKSRGNKVNDSAELTEKPQRFALPRINRNHLRI